ncbi:MAG: lipopolysaccharide biosynthesis protein [Alphaproteobacteria bacterium]|nr:lipopolysaccharide biosynthesis protein [Alphaproteobacteria bacterium]
MSSQDTASLSGEVFRGTKWYMAMRWSIRGLGFISSAFLARLLMPEDFGLVATVLVIFGLISLLFEFGVNWALIQNNKATDDHFHTAWTLRLLQSLVIALLLAAFSPLIADIYGDVRLELICQIFAVGTMIRGFENIGTVKLQKDMRFSKDFLYNVAPKVISTFVTIGLAFHYKSYMALVIGAVSNNLIIVIASYLVINFRPRFSFAKISEIWGFSQWILVRNIAQYISTQGDLFFLAMLTTPAKIGYYKWGTELSFMTITEIQQPFNRALVPGLVKIKHDHDRLINAYLKALGLMTLISVPAALGFGAVAEQLIPIFLGGGDKWLPVVPLAQGLVFYAMSYAVYGISVNLLSITGNIKYTAYMLWIQAIFTIATLYPAYHLAGLEGIAYSRGLIGIVVFFIISFLVVKKCHVSFSQIVNVIWRPTLAGTGMFIILVNMPNLWMLGNPAMLLIKIISGTILYISFILFLWWLSKKPVSAEQTLLSSIKSRMPFK